MTREGTQRESRLAREVKVAATQSASQVRAGAPDPVDRSTPATANGWLLHDVSSVAGQQHQRRNGANEGRALTHRHTAPPSNNHPDPSSVYRSSLRQFPARRISPENAYIDGSKWQQDAPARRHPQICGTAADARCSCHSLWRLAATSVASG